MIILGGQNSNGSDPEEIMAFDMEKLVWKEVPLLDGPLPVKYGFSASAFHQNKVITYGGINRNDNKFTDLVNILTVCDAKGEYCR